MCCVAALVALASCDDDEASPYLALRELDASAQPKSTELGVLVAVSAEGADGIRFEVAGGSLEVFGPSPLTPLCVDTHLGSERRSFENSQRKAVSFVVAVHPTKEEALLSASLGKLSPKAFRGEGGSGGQPDQQSAGAEACASVGFEALPVYAAMVVSIGRAAPAASGGAASGGTAAGGTSAGGTSAGGIGGAEAAGVGGGP
ncbi:MAG: hypothetical protein QM756_12805 [Polyangiaceae bacterium]